MSCLWRGKRLHLRLQRFDRTSSDPQLQPLRVHLEGPSSRQGVGLLMVESTKLKRKRAWIIIGILASIILIIGTVPYLANRPVPPPAPPSGPNVSIWDSGLFCSSATNCGYSPTSKNAPSGTTITWTNTGRQSHTATECTVTDSNDACPNGAGANTSNSRAFDSNAQSSLSLNNNQQYQFAINLSQGTYYYHCTLHAWMHGTLVVQ